MFTYSIGQVNIPGFGAKLLEYSDQADGCQRTGDHARTKRLKVENESSSPNDEGVVCSLRQMKSGKAAQ